jgi:hypothetical protein
VSWTKADLSLLEQTFLGVLGCGIVPASLARDESFRLDYVTAVAHALREGLPREAYLQAPGAFHVKPEFTFRLQQAMESLDEKRIIGLHEPAAPPPELLGTRRVPGPDMVLTTIETSKNPTVFDRHLSGVCMEDLLSHPDRELYRFLMDRYAESGLHWQRLMRAGYGSGPLL